MHLQNREISRVLLRHSEGNFGYSFSSSIYLSVRKEVLLIANMHFQIADAARTKSLHERRVINLLGQ